MQTTGGSQRPMQRRPANVPTHAATSAAPTAPSPSSAMSSTEYSSAQASSRNPSNSSRSQQQPTKRTNQSQQLSQIEKSVTHLLVATKQLLETLTQWSRHHATEAEVSDVYVRLGYEFNIASRAFNAIGVDTADLGNVPELLRAILEEALSQEASPASLDRYLPRIRDIIINLLHGLKRKQQKLRQRAPRDDSPVAAAAAAAAGASMAGRQNSVASNASGESTLTRMLDDGTARFSGNAATSQGYLARSGSKDSQPSEDSPLPPRSSSVPLAQGGRVSPVRADGMPVPHAKTRAPISKREASSTRKALAPTSATVAGVSSQYPISAAEFSAEAGVEGERWRDGHATAFLPPPPPPKQQDALAALQRGGDLERRASRRYSAYQISKHLGASPNGVPMLPPAQMSPIPNRGRDARESMNAVRVRGAHLANAQRSPNRAEPSSSRHLETPSRISEESVASSVVSTTQTEDDGPTDGVEGGVRPRSSDERLGRSSSNARPNAVVGPSTLVEASPAPPSSSHAATGSSRREERSPSKIMRREVPSRPFEPANHERATSTPPTEATPPRAELSPQPGKELTLFLQYKSKIKKFVLPEGDSELSIPRLQLAFIEKFSWNTHSNGNDLPDIYIQDPVSGVRHELEDLSDVRDRSVLVLNVEPLDEVKRHIDEKMAGLGKLMEDVRAVVDGQQTTIQRVSERQTDAAKELARLAVSPSPASNRSSFANPPLANGIARGLSASEKSKQLNNIQTLRRDLAGLRQTYASFVSDIQASMTDIRSKAGSVKSAASTTAAAPLDSDSGRAYVNKGKKELGEVSDALVNQVDDLQDIVEDLRKDVVTRGVRPLPRQLETVGKDIAAATSELKKIQEYLRREKPKWSKIWEMELQVVCDDRDLLTMQEALAADLQDDLESAAQTFALVEEATKEQMKDGHSAMTRAMPRTLNPIAVDSSVDPQMAKESVLGEVRALQPNHENRLEAIERAERARQKELESRPGGELQKELGSFVDEGRLKKSGGVEEVERQRTAKDDRIRKEVWERQNAASQAKAMAESEAATPADPSPDVAADLGPEPAVVPPPPADEAPHATKPTPDPIPPADEGPKRSSWLPAVFGI
ncbi:MAG: Bud site selection protein 6 [Phylliscum demangeonii]|nr:MAG: Bud site selection protein 6 [Phylliscum demangeonii]